MINRRQYYKSRDKKILHKIHKKWVVISLAMLGVFGLGSVMAGSGPVHAATASPSTPTTTKPAQITQQTSTKPAASTPATHANAGQAQSVRQVTNTKTPVQSTNKGSVNQSQQQASTLAPKMATKANNENTGVGQMTTAQSQRSASARTNVTISNNQQQTKPVHSMASRTTVPKANTQISQVSQVSASAKSADSVVSSVSSNASIKSNVMANGNKFNKIQSTRAPQMTQDDLHRAAIAQQKTDEEAKAALAKNSWGHLKNRGLNLSESENMQSRKMLNKQEHLSQLLQQNSWNGSPEADLNMNKHADHLLGDSPTIHVDGDSVTYNGNVQLHFYNNKGQDFKDLSVPYSTTSEVGDTATVVDPNNYLDKTIQGFNTTGYHLVNGNPITKTVSPDDVPNGASQAVITNNYSFDYMSDEAAQPTIDTDIIHYVANGGVVSKTTVSGQPGAQTTVTGAGLAPGYKLANDGSQSFQIDNGTHDVNVVAIPSGTTTNGSNNHNEPSNVNRTDTIYYIYNGNNEGSTTMTGPQGQTVPADGSNMPNGYQLIGQPSITFDGDPHSIDITPINTNGSSSTSSDNGSNNNVIPNGSTVNNNSNPINQMDVDQIDYIYQGVTKGSSVMRGRNGVSTSADGNGMPAGFKLANDGSQSFVFDNGTHSVDIMPVSGSSTKANQDNDTLNFLYNGLLKGSTTKSGTDKMTGVVQQGDIPGGFELAPNTPNSFVFDNGIHNIDVVPLSNNNQAKSQSNSSTSSATKSATSATSTVASSSASSASKSTASSATNSQNSNKPTPVVGQGSIIITYVNTSNGQIVDQTMLNNNVGQQFDAQDYTGMAPQGYQFQRIVNPINHFIQGSQSMWIYVVPMSTSMATNSSTSTASNVVVHSSQSTSITSKSASSSTPSNMSTASKASSSSTSNVVNHSNASTTANSTANSAITSSGIDSTIKSLANRVANSASQNAQVTPTPTTTTTTTPTYSTQNPMFQLTPSENRNHSYLEGYSDAVNHHRINPSDYGYDANYYNLGFDDGVSHLLHERKPIKNTNAPSTSSTKNSSISPKTDNTWGYNQSTPEYRDTKTGVTPTEISTDTPASTPIGTSANTGTGFSGYSYTTGGATGSIINALGGAAQDDADNDDTSSTPSESAPEPGSVYDGYVVYQDEIGIYIIINGVKVYWDYQTQTFDLVWSSSQNTLIPYIQVFGTEPNV